VSGIDVQAIKTRLATTLPGRTANALTTSAAFRAGLRVYGDGGLTTRKGAPAPRVACDLLTAVGEAVEYMVTKHNDETMALVAEVERLRDAMPSKQEQELLGLLRSGIVESLEFGAFTIRKRKGSRR